MALVVATTITRIRIARNVMRSTTPTQQAIAGSIATTMSLAVVTVNAMEQALACAKISILGLVVIAIVMDMVFARTTEVANAMQRGRVIDVPLDPTVRPSLCARLVMATEFVN